MATSSSSSEQRKERAYRGESQDQSSDSLDVYSSFLKSEINVLGNIILTQFGFLDILVSERVLTSKQVSLFQFQATCIEVMQIGPLLREITRDWTQSISEDEKAKFLNALDRTQQKHASNWIRGKGEHAAEYGDDWPLYLCTEKDRINAKKWELIELIDSRKGLLDEMFSREALNLRQKHTESRATEEQINENLISVIIRGSLATYKAFIQCPLQTKQHQVASLLEPGLVGDIRPLTKKQQSRLQRNHGALVRCINLKDGMLTAKLFEADCITSRQKEYIEHDRITQSENNTRLLDIMRRGSQTNFNKFVECLDRTGHRHVSRILNEDVAVAYIVATTSSANNREIRERRLVELMSVLRDIPDECIVDLVDEARQRLNPLRDNDVAISTAETGHSIGLFYFTTSLRGVQYLNEIYSNEQLKSMMQGIFIILLKTDDADDAALDLRVDTLRWNPSNYTECLQQLCTISNLSILSRVHEMTEQSRKFFCTSDDMRSLPIDQLPYKLVEIIKIQAIGHLFVAINRTTSTRAQVYTLATMMAVSHLWWVALSHRKYIKRLLKRSFKRVCLPYKCSPQHVTRLHIEGGKKVMGVAVLNDELYVARGESNTIQVFDIRPPFSRQEDIEVQGLRNASDITVCSKSSQLYIADHYVIWRVNLLCIKPADRFITIQWMSYSLSVNSSRLLITPNYGGLLSLYGDDGDKLHGIELPRYMEALHAVETTFNAYLVSHFNAFIGDTSTHPHSVTEVDVHGRVIRTFNYDIDSIHFMWPIHLVLDNDHVLVADRHNHCIILLKSDLQFKRILIKELPGKRSYRICLASSRLLAVSYGSTDIYLFKI